MPKISAEQEPNLCICGCICCSAPSSTAYFVVKDSAKKKAKKLRVQISVGVQTDDARELRCNFSCNEEITQAVQALLSSEMPPVEEVDTEVASINSETSVTAHRQLRSAGRKSLPLVEESNSDVASVSSEASVAAHRQLRRSAGRKSLKPVTKPKSKEKRRQSVATTASTNTVADEMEPRRLRPRLSNANASATSVLSQTTSSVKDAAKDIDVAALDEAVTCFQAAENLASVTVCCSESNGDADHSPLEHSPSTTICNCLEAALPESVRNVGFWLDGDSIAGKTLVNTMLNRTSIHLLTFIAQPERGMKIKSPRCEIVSEEARLLADCDWIFICLDEEGSAFSRLDGLTSVVSNRKGGTRSPNLVIVRSKTLSDQTSSLHLLSDAALACDFPLLDLALVFGWFPSGADANSGENVPGKKSKKLRPKSTKYAKAVVRSSSKHLFDSFKNIFNPIFEDCILLGTNVGSTDILMQYFSTMEAGVMTGANCLTEIPTALDRAMGPKDGSYRVVDISVSNVLHRTLLILVEIESEIEVESSQTPTKARESCSPRFALRSKKAASRTIRKILVVNFDGTVRETLDLQSDLKNYVATRLVFDYCHRSMHRIVFGAFDAQRYRLRMYSLLVKSEVPAAADTEEQAEKPGEVESFISIDLCRNGRPFYLDAQTADCTAFAADIAGEYESPISGEFAELNGATWGFCGVRNTMFELLLHGQKSSFTAFDILNAEKALIRGVKYVAARRMLLVSTFSAALGRYSMHFLHLNPVTKLFEPQVVVFERAACESYRLPLLDYPEVLVFDETRCRMHLFAVVGAQSKPDASEAVENGNCNANGLTVHGDRFCIDDNLRVTYEDCFPDFNLAFGGSDATNRNQAGIRSVERSCSMVSFTQTFRNFVWCTGGRFYASSSD